MYGVQLYTSSLLDRGHKTTNYKAWMDIVQWPMGIIHKSHFVALPEPSFNIRKYLVFGIFLICILYTSLLDYIKTRQINSPTLRQKFSPFDNGSQRNIARATYGWKQSVSAEHYVNLMIKLHNQTLCNVMNIEKAPS